MAHPDTHLVLRVCRADFTSHNGFRWPDQVGATVEAPDWRDDEECGHGLHGWLYGAGYHSVSDHYTDGGARWMVLAVASDDLRMLGGKVKFPRCAIQHIGDRKSATDYLLANESRAKSEKCIGAVVAVGDGEYGAVGALGTLTGGNCATLTGGYRATLTGGNCAELRIRYWDSKAARYRTAIAYVGEDGIKPNVAYRLDGSKFVEVQP